MSGSTLDQAEFAAGYAIEADEHVRAAVNHLLAVEAALTSGAAQHRHVRELFRSLHTIKGLSAMVGVEPIVELAHEMEALLREADRSTGKLLAREVEALLQGVHAIEQRLASFAKQSEVPPAPRSLIELFDQLQRAVRPTDPSAGPSVVLDPELLAKLTPLEQQHLASSIVAGARGVRIDFAPSPEKSAAGITITTARENLAKVGEIVKVIPRAVSKSADAPGGVAFALLLLTHADDVVLEQATHVPAGSFVAITLEGPAIASSSDDDDLPEVETAVGQRYVRVEVERLDDALEKLSALVVSRFKLAHAVEALRERGLDVRELSMLVGENHRQLRDLRRAITRARMVSVNELLERVPLIVRGMGRTTGKQIKLIVDAGKAELDKTVAERVFPAIVHIIRNAIDHALESSEERLRAGKPAEGTVTVVCYEHSDTQLEIRISDDGRGIDPVAVARRAGRETPLDNLGLLELVTLPGLSTRDAATSVSGRGMGMDIVRRAVAALGGDLSLATELGRGTTFTMRLPLSISIVDSFSFVCSAQTFAVPVAIVDEIIDLSLERVIQPPAPRRRQAEAQVANARILERRGEAIPLFGLARVLQLEVPDADRGKALIVRPQGQPCAFAIDRMLGQQEIVVRPVEDALIKVPGVAGTTDLGDGRPTLVLDLIGLCAVATSAGATRALAVAP